MKVQEQTQLPQPQQENISFKEESISAEMFFFKFILVILFVALLAIPLAVKYKEKIVAFLNKNYKSSKPKEDVSVQSVRLSAKTTVHIVQTEGVKVAVAESSLNVSVVDLLKTISSEKETMLEQGAVNE